MQELKSEKSGKMQKWFKYLGPIILGLLCFFAFPTVQAYAEADNPIVTETPLANEQVAEDTAVGQDADASEGGEQTGAVDEGADGTSEGEQGTGIIDDEQDMEAPEGGEQAGPIDGGADGTSEGEQGTEAIDDEQDMEVPEGGEQADPIDEGAGGTSEGEQGTGIIDDEQDMEAPEGGEQADPIDGGADGTSEGEQGDEATEEGENVAGPVTEEQSEAAVDDETTNDSVENEEPEEEQIADGANEEENSEDNSLEEEIIDESQAEEVGEDSVIYAENQSGEAAGVMNFGEVLLPDITISGTVYDSITKEAIRNAEIIFSGGKADEKFLAGGLYGYKYQDYDQLPENTKYTLTAKADGYEEYSWEFEVEHSKIVVDGHRLPTVHDIDFYLAPTEILLQGELVDTGISGSWASMDNKVVIDQDLIYSGYDLNIKASATGEFVNEDPFEEIIVQEGITITTRKIDPGEEPGDYLNAPSVGDSGDIYFHAAKVDIGKDVKILAHASEPDPAFKAGDIVIESLATAGTDLFDLAIANVDHAKASIEIGDGSILKGRNVKLNAKADNTVIFAETEEDEETLLDTLFINDIIEKALGAIEGFSLIGGVSVSQATSLISLGENTLIEADNFAAQSSTYIKAAAAPTAIAVGVAVGVGIADAQVILKGKIITAEDCKIESLADNTLSVKGASGGIAGLSAGVAVSILQSNSKVSAENSSDLQVGGDLTLRANTIDRNYTLASSTSGDDGKVGLAIAVSVENGMTEAFLAGKADVAGNIMVEALMTEEETDKGKGIYAVAGANTSSSGQVSGDMKTAITDRIKAIGKNIGGKVFNYIIGRTAEAKEKTGTDTKVTPFELAAATAVYVDNNTVTARISEGAEVKSRGFLTVHARAENQPHVVATGSAEEKDESGGGQNPGGGSAPGGGGAGPDPDPKPGTGADSEDGTKFAGAAAIAVGIYNNQVSAYISKDARVDAAKALTVNAEYINDYELIYGVELLEYLYGEFLTSDDGIKTIKKDQIVGVKDGYSAGGEAGNLYQYLGDDPLTVNLGAIDYQNKKLWKNLGPEWRYRSIGFIKQLAEYLDADDLGTTDNLTNFWVQSNAAGAKVGISGSVSVMVRDNEAQAYIDKNALINHLDDSEMAVPLYRSGEQNVKVLALLVDEIIYFSGNIELPGLSFDKKKFKIQGSLGGYGTDAETVAAGGSLIVIIQNNTAKSEIRDGVQLYADNLDVKANSQILNVVVSAAGGKSEKFGIEGTFALILLDNQTIAQISNGARAVVPGKLVVKAEDQTYVIDLAGAIASGGNVGVGGSVGINLVNRNTQAVIGSLEIKTDGVKPIDPELTVDAGNVRVEARNDGFIIALGAAGAFSSEESESSSGSVESEGSSAPEGGGSYGVGISGVVVANNMHDEVLAYIKQTVLRSSNVVITSNNRTKVIAVGGSVAIVDKEGTSAGLAGALAFNRVDNRTKAYIDQSDLSLTGELEIKADAEELIVSVSASGSGSTASNSGSVAGQVSLNTIASEVIAAILNSSEIAARNIKIEAIDSTMIIAVAGALSYGGKAGIGSAVALNDIPIEALGGQWNKVKAYIENSDVDASGKISLEALANNLIIAVAAAAGGSNEGMAVAASITVNTITVDIASYIIGKKMEGITATGDITLKASDHSAIYSLAGAGTFSQDGSTVGVAIAYNNISNGIKAYIGDIKNEKYTAVISGAKLNMAAFSQAMIVNIAVGGGYGTKFTGNGSVSVNTIRSEVATYIVNSGVKANADIFLTATDQSLIGAIAGEVGISQEVAVGGSIALNFIGGITKDLLGPHQVLAYIENSRVVSENGSIALKALSETVIKSISAAGGFAGKVAVNGSVSINWIYTDVGAYIKDCVSTDDSKLIWAKKDITLDAVDNSVVSVIAGDISGGGTVGAGASIAIVFVGSGGASLLDLIAELYVNDVFEEGEYPYGDLYDKDYEAKHQNDNWEGYEGGPSAADYQYPSPEFEDSGKVRAYISNSRVEAKDGSVQLTATGNSIIFSISAGLAVGGKGGAYRGSLAVNYVHNEALALIINSLVEAGKDVTVVAAAIDRNWIPKDALQVEWDADNAKVYSFDGSGGREVGDDVIKTDPKSPERFTSIQAIAGGVSGGLNVGLGGALAVNYILNNYEAGIINSAISAVGDVKVLAQTSSGAIAFALSDNFFPFALVGSLSLNVINNEIKSHISGSTVGAKNIYVLARDTSFINSFSGQLGLSAGYIMAGPLPIPTGAAFGVASAYNDISGIIKAYVDDVIGVNTKKESSLTALNNIMIEALSNAAINTIAAGGSMSFWVGASGTVTTNFIKELVEAYITNSNVIAEHNIYLLAGSDSFIGSYGGALGAGAVGVGASAIINIIDNITKAYLESSDVIAKGKGDAIAVLKWDDNGVKGSENAKGLIVIAQGKDVITIYAGTLAIGGGALSGEIFANFIKHLTEAYISSSKINAPGEWGSQVIIRASQDTGVAVYSGAAAAGGTALGGAVNSINLENLTKAYIDDNSLVYALNGIKIQALTNFAPIHDGPGVVLGGLSVAGSWALSGVVSVITMKNSNEAFVDNAVLYSRNFIVIESLHNVKINNIIAQAAAGGFAGGGGSIFLNSLENLVRAYVQNSALNAVNAITVKAKSLDDLQSIIGTGGAGLVVGAAGAISLTLIDNITEAYLHGDINPDNDFKSGGLYQPVGNNEAQTVLVLADNQTKVKTIGGVVGVGAIAGVGSSLDFVNIQNKTLSAVKAGSRLYTMGDVIVRALSEKIVDSDVYSFAGGLAGLSGAVSIIIVGGAIDEEGKSEFNDSLLGQLARDLSLDSLLYYENDKGVKTSRLPGQIGDRTVDLINAFDISRLTNALDTNKRGSGITEAAVEDAPNGDLKAQIIAKGKVLIEALNKNSIKSRLNNAVGGAAAVAGGTIGRAAVSERTRAGAGKYSYIRAAELGIKADSLDHVVVHSQAASGVLGVGLHAYVAQASVAPIVEAWLGDYANVIVDEAVQIDADATPEVVTKVEANDLGGMGTIGASIANSLVEPIVKAWIGEHVEVLATTMPVSGKPVLTLLDKAELTGNPNLEFRGYTIRAQGSLIFARGLAMSGNPELIFDGPPLVEGEYTLIRGDGTVVEVTGYGSLVFQRVHKDESQVDCEFIPGENGANDTLKLSVGFGGMLDLEAGQFIRVWPSTDLYRVIGISKSDSGFWEKTIYTLTLDTKGYVPEAIYYQAYIQWYSNTITRGTGNWREEGFVAGDYINYSGYTINSGNYVIWDISEDGKTIHLDPKLLIESGRVGGTYAVISADRSHDRLRSQNMPLNLSWEKIGIREGTQIALEVPGDNSSSGAYTVLAILRDGTLLLDSKSKLVGKTTQATVHEIRNSTITRNNGSWVTDRFYANQAIAISGTRYNDGQYSIQSISPDGKTLFIKDNFVLKGETIGENSTVKNLIGTFVLKQEWVTGENGRQENLITLSRNDLPNWEWEQLKLRVGDYIILESLRAQIIGINGDQLILNTPGVLLEESANFSSVQMEYLRGKVMVRTADDGAYDQIVFSESGIFISELTNSRGDKIQIGDYITIITPNGVNSGIYKIIGFNGRRAILETSGQVESLTINNTMISKIIPSELNRSEGSWVADGFVPGQIIHITGAQNPQNNGYFEITDIINEGKTLKLERGKDLADENSSGSNVTVTGDIPNQIFRGEGNWLDDGFAPGQKIRLSGSDSGNDGIYTIHEITADGKVLVLDVDGQFMRETSQGLMVELLEQYKSRITVNARVNLPKGGKTAIAEASGVSGSILASVNGVWATARVNPTVQAYIGSDSRLDVDGTLEVAAKTDTKHAAYTDTVNIGSVAVGANLATAEADSETTVIIGQDVLIRAHELLLKAIAQENAYAQAESGNGGLIAGNLTEAKTINNSNTTASVKGATVEADGFNLEARHIALYNSRVNTFSAAVLNGSAGKTSNETNARVKAQVATDAEIMAHDILILADNYTFKDWLDDDAANVNAGSGGGIDVPATLSDTLINQNATIEISDDAILNLVSNPLYPGDINLAAYNHLVARDKVKLNALAAITWATAKSSINATERAEVIIGNRARLNSEGNINISAHSLADIEGQTDINIAGKATRAGGDSYAQLNNENRITLRPDALLFAEGVVNLLAGKNIFDEENSLRIRLNSIIMNNGVIPITSPNAEGYINLGNFITIEAGGRIKSGGDVNLITETGAVFAEAKISGIDWVKSALGAEIKGGTGKHNINSLIRIDGDIEAGQRSRQILIIDQNGNIVKDQSSEGITVSYKKELLHNYLLEEIRMLKSLAVEYAGTEAGAAFEAQIAFLENELRLMGYQAGGPAVPIWIDIIVVGNIRAEQPVINIVAEDGSLLGNGKINASTQPALIKVINNSAHYLELGSLIIPERAGGFLYYNHWRVEGDRTIANAGIKERNNIKVESPGFTIISLGSGGTAPAEIYVENTYYSSGRNPDIRIMGGIRNIGYQGSPGIVTIKGTGSIAAYGSLEAGDLTIEAGGNFSQSYTDTFFSIGGSPRAIWGDFVRSYIQGQKLDYPWRTVRVRDKNNPFVYTWERQRVDHYDELIAAILWEVPENMIKADNIFIAARYLNINGTIEAGRSDYIIDLGYETEALINWYKYQGIGSQNYKDYPLYTGSYAYYYDPVTDAIVLEPIVARGGYMELFGQIISTGNGNIRALDGYGAIIVNNYTGYDLVIKGLNTGVGSKGVVIITDTSPQKQPRDNVYLTTRYEREGEQIVISTWYTDNKGQIISTSTIDGNRASYQPTEGWRFDWVMGQSISEKRIELYCSKVWITDWLAADPDDLISTEYYPVGTPHLLPDGEYLRYSWDERNEPYTYKYAYHVLDEQYWQEGNPKKREQWWEQSWFAAPIYYYTRDTYERGSLEVYYHSIKADYPIKIEFSGSSQGALYVSSKGNLIIDGEIKNELGVTELRTEKSIYYNTDLPIAFRRLELHAGSGIGVNQPVIVEQRGGEESQLIAHAGQDINIKEISSELIVGSIISDYGNINLEAQTSILGYDTNSIIVAGRIELFTPYGGIGSAASPLVINSGAGDGKGVSILASGDINLQESVGNLQIISIVSKNGNIKLKAVDGSILDGTPDDYIGNVYLLELWDGKTEYDLNEIKAFLQKSHLKRIGNTNYWANEANLSGAKITLEAVQNIGGVEELKINLVNGKMAMNAELATMLAGAEYGDVEFHDGYLILKLYRGLTVDAKDKVNIFAGGAIYLNSEETLTIEKIESSSATSGVRIKSGNGIFSAPDANPGSANISGGSILLEGGQGALGTKTAWLKINLSSAGTLTARSEEDIYLINTGGIIVDSIETINGDVHLTTSSGSIKLGQINAQKGVIYLTAQGSILGGTDVLPELAAKGMENFWLTAGGSIVDLVFLAFDLGGGNLLLVVAVEKGRPVTEPVKPIKSGHTFIEWCVDTALSTPYDFSANLTENLILYARWEAGRYTISFDSNGGSTVAAITQDCDTTVTAPANPTKEGYTFKGWYSDVGLTTPYTFTTMPAEDLVLYAKWEINQYTISFESDGGSTVAAITQGYGSTITAPANPTKAGYTFVGWSAAIPTTMPAENITLKAQWKINQYTITFDSNGGSAVESITRDYGTTVAAPANPTKEGYTFKGWYSDVGLTTPYTFATMPAEDLVLYAKWEINQYTISFESDGGSTMDPITQNYNTAITVPADPTKEGYTFIGWSAAIPTTMPAENITLKAQWKINQYTITFDSNGGSAVESITRDYGTTVAAPANPTKAGYSFKGWYSDVGLTTPYTFTTMPAEDLVLYAKWEINQYTISFESDGGSTVDPITQNYNTAITVPADPTKEGYTFIGWSAAIPTTMPAENITLNAQWKINQYTITFDSNGGSAVESIARDYGTTVAAPANPTKEGYSFKGWYSDAELTTPYTFTIIPAEDLTLYAKWEINQYTITFDSDGGSAVDPITQNYNTAITVPADPTKEGYIFVGWSTAIPPTMPAANITLTAQWKANQYTITFDSNGGSAVASITQDYGTTVVAPSNPTKKGYAFKGWYIDTELTIPYTFTTMAAENITLTARWGTVGGGSSDESGKGTTNPTETAKVEVEVAGNVVTATTTVEATADSSGTTTVAVSQSQIGDAISKATEEVKKQAEGTVARVEIKVEGPAGAAGIVTNIPQAAVNQATEAGIDALTITTPIATVTFGAGALSSLSRETTGEVVITAARVEVSTLAATVRQRVGDRPVFDFRVTDGSGTVTQFAGDVTVSIPYTPKEGEDVNAIVIYYIGDSGEPELVSNCFYDPVTGRVNFSTGHFSHYAVGYNKINFKDVAEGSWYGDAVSFIAAREITWGTGDGNFSPESKLTRGQFIVMLMRAYGIAPDVDPSDNFSDADLTYCTGYLAAAKRLGIANGVGNNMFAPDDAITRQEMFTLLYNVLRTAGRLPLGTRVRPLSAFDDVLDIAPWADEAMTFLTETGVINGCDGKLMPGNATTRAEMAQVLYNLLSR